MTDPVLPRPRRPLDAGRVRAALEARGAGMARVRLLGATASTNADAAAAARAGEPAGLVVAAEEQTAGRGRLDRTWAAPASSSVLMSVLLRPPATVPPTAWAWLPLLAGLAAAAAVRETTGVPAVLKWPNDVVVDGPGRDGDPGPRKLAGVLLEQSGGAAVVGMGINADLAPEELPTPAATSLLLEAGAAPDREELLAAAVAHLIRRAHAWAGAGGDAARCGLADEYRGRCLTLGRRVAALLPDGSAVEGPATAIGPDGALVIGTAGGPQALRAGDIVHLRPAAG